MAFVTIKEAQKWLIDNPNNAELKHIRHPIFVISKYEELNPSDKVIWPDGTVTLGKQKVEVDLTNTILTFQPAKGSYRAHTKVGWKDIIKLNREIPDTALKEHYKIRIIDVKNQKRYMLKENDISEARSRTGRSRFGSLPLYPVYLNSNLEEKSNESDMTGKITDY